jgi:hypothetical protein
MKWTIVELVTANRIVGEVEADDREEAIEKGYELPHPLGALTGVERTELYAIRAIDWRRVRRKEGLPDMEEETYD